jgi:hypothetical protein
MTRYQTAVEEFVTQQELHGLAKATGPCISATVNIPDPAHLRPEMNKTIRELEKRLKVVSPDVRTAQTLLEPLREFALTTESDGDWAVTLALYRSPDTFHCFRLPEMTTESVSIESVFQVRPLLTILSREQRFHILALSQKKVRLYDCSPFRIQEVELHGRVPQNLRVFLNGGTPDQVFITTGDDRDRHEEYLTHFFQEINKGLHKVLDDDTAPLLLAGVEYEVALYRRVNNYPHIMDQAIHGSPEGLRPQQLHEESLAIMRRHFSAPLEKVMRDFPNHRNSNRVAFDLTEVTDAAQKGRISHLLLREDADGRQFNLIALQTLAHGGEAYALKESEMPEHADIAAVVRYSS